MRDIKKKKLMCSQAEGHKEEVQYLKSIIQFGQLSENELKW
jgi:hypothetical protein